MKSFKKYNFQSRREFLSRGEYNSWGKGRYIIKEGYPALALYFILDGEISISKIIESNTADKQSENTTKKCKRWTGENMVQILKLSSGDAFGEVAFTISSDHTRAATAKTLKNTDFLLVEIQDATHIIKTHNDNSFARKSEFIASLPLLRTLRVDANALAYFCSFKSASVNSHLLVEGMVLLVIQGENSPFLYFIKSGDCRLLKTVQIAKHKNGAVSLRTLDGKNHTVSEIDETLTSSPHFTYHLIVMGNLLEGDHFGEGYISNQSDPLKMLNGTVGIGNSRFSGILYSILTA